MQIPESWKSKVVYIKWRDPVKGDGRPHLGGLAIWHEFGVVSHIDKKVVCITHSYAPEHVAPHNDVEEEWTNTWVHQELIEEAMVFVGAVDTRGKRVTPNLIF